MSSSKKTHIMLRVFFVVACLSLIGMIVGQHTKFTTEVKTPGGSFTEGVVGAPRFINPVLAQSSAEKDLTKLIFGSLLYIENNEIKYDLAESLEVSEDKKEYTIHLRKDLSFHDGEHITADDLMFTIEKVQDAAIKGPLSIFWEGVSAEKKDTYTVTFKISKVYADFPHNLNIGILPKHLWKNISSQEFAFSPHNTKPVGSGPYKILETQNSTKGTPEIYTLTRHEDFRDSYIKEIRFRIFENEESRVKAYNEGVIDVMYDISMHQDKLALKDETGIYTGILPSVYGIFFNQNNNPILKDAYVREALSKSFNTRQIIEQVYQSDARHIDNLVGIPSTTDNYDPVAAQTLLEKNGWIKNETGIFEKNGTQLAFTLSTSNNRELKRFADYTQSNLQKNGILMDVKTFDEGDFTQNVIRPREYESVLFGYKIQKNTDLYSFWHSSQKDNPGLNISIYANKNVDKILQTLRIDSINFKQDTLIQEVNDDTPALFLYSPTYNYLLPNEIQDVDISIVRREDRFNKISNWYMNTRHVWNFFAKK